MIILIIHKSVSGDGNAFVYYQSAPHMRKPEYLFLYEYHISKFLCIVIRKAAAYYNFTRIYGF